MNEEIRPPVTIEEPKPKVQEIPPPTVGPFAPAPVAPLLEGVPVPPDLELIAKAKAFEITVPAARMGAKGK